MSSSPPVRNDDASVDGVIGKHEETKVEYVDVNEHITGAAPQMRSKMDDLSVWESVKAYRLVTCVGMAAAFSASLDGYRESPAV